MRASLLVPDSHRNPDYRWFAEARFGMFIHFSLASMFGKGLGYELERT